MTSQFRTILFRVVCASLLLGAAGFPQSAPAGSQPAEFNKDRSALTEHITKIASPGVPGSFCIFGGGAFSVVSARTGRDSRAPVVAAARAGKGRIVAFGHGGFLESSAVADTGALLENAVRWAAARDRAEHDGKPIEVGVMGAGPKSLVEMLHSRGFGVHEFKAGEARDDGAKPDVIVGDIANLSEANITFYQKFVENGGGMVVSGLGWGWLQLNPGKTLDDYPANHLLRKYGIVYTGGTVEPDGEKLISLEKSSTVNPELLEASRALDWMLQKRPAAKTKQQKAELAQASRTLTDAALAIPLSDEGFRARVGALMKEHGAELIPSEKRPLAAGDALARCLLAFQLRDLDRVPVEATVAHPAAADFPGAVPATARRISAKISVNLQIPGWHSTGLYAAPGEKIKITVPESMAAAGAGVRIGCHTDDLWHLDTWKRVPDISRRFDIKSVETLVASPFGGLLYIDIPKKQSGTAEVAIEGAVAAPRFVLGRTTNEEWRDGIRALPAPWAELESDKIILSIPSAVAQKIDDPEKIMKYWCQVADGAAELYGRPKTRERAERFCADMQISAGYMHSGYPIMTHLDGAEHLTNWEILHSSKGWGVYHELGHNHQEGDWTFEGTGEVTNNIFTVYAIEVVAGANVTDGDRSPEKRLERMKPYFAAGAPFEKWKSEPFLALDMYLQLKEAFGWDVYKKVFAEYRGLKREERPRGDAAKRDQWMVRMSRAAGRNLGPFFVAWGVPVSERARKSIEDLPAWMPENFPPK